MQANCEGVPRGRRVATLNPRLLMQSPDNLGQGFAGKADSAAPRYAPREGEGLSVARPEK